MRFLRLRDRFQSSRDSRYERTRASAFARIASESWPTTHNDTTTRSCEQPQLSLGRITQPLCDATRRNATMANGRRSTREQTAYDRFASGEGRVYERHGAIRSSQGAD